MITGNNISNNHCQEPLKSLFSEIILRNIISNSLQITFWKQPSKMFILETILNNDFQKMIFDDCWQELSQTANVSIIFARNLSSNHHKQHSQRTSENDFWTYSFQEIMLTKIRKKDDFWMTVGNDISKNHQNHFSKEPVIRNKIELTWRNSSQIISERLIEKTDVNNFQQVVPRNHHWEHLEWSLSETLLRTISNKSLKNNRMKQNRIIWRDYS